MKPLLLLLINNMIFFATTAQVKIGNNASIVNPNTVLELESTNKGLLLPRLTTAQINTMSGPPKGMIVFNNTDSCLYVRRDSGWTIIPVAAGVNSKTLYWENNGNDIGNINTGRVNINTNDGIVAKGNYGVGNNLTEAGAGTKMIWYPKRAAFRAGEIDADQWDIGNIGQHSFASGFNTKASGPYSIAMGHASEATNDFSVALGYYSVVSGEYAFAAGHRNTASGDIGVALGAYNTASDENAVAIGYNNVASGRSAIAIGDGTDATGDASFATNESTLAGGTRSAAFNFLTTASGACATAFGIETTASGACATAFGILTAAKASFSMATGMYNDISDNPTNAATDRVFQIGNGSSMTARSNAITVLRNGNTGIGVVQPNAKLEIRGALGFSSTTKRWEMNYDSTGGYFYIDEFGFGRHFIIENGGSTRLSGNLMVQGNKGIIRNSDGTQLKKVSATAVVATSFTITETKSFSITWPESFSSAPEAYIGNVVGGSGGWAEVIMTLGNVTSTGAVLYVYNAKPNAVGVNFSIKIIAMGPQ